MKVSAIITEYNPFHNGHKYQLDTVSALTNCDYKVIIMSGNFVQRGQPAIIDKYSRTKMALCNGADLVLELPTVYATASAEFFAKGAISILKSCSIIDHLCYGVENLNHSLLKSIAYILINEPEEYSAALQQNLKKGANFPSARTNAIMQTLTSRNDFDSSEVSGVISKPNNILAIEYEKALANTNITGFPIKRIGSGYHDTDCNTDFPSATAIRGMFSSGTFMPSQNIMPQVCSDIISSYVQHNNLVFEDDISDILYYRLLSQKENGFTQFSDCNIEIASRITKNIYLYKNFSQFCELLKSKNYTYTRISRALIHILLNIKSGDLSLPPYIRILGFKKSASPLLHQLKKSASVPIITKVADAPYELISKDIFAADIYNRLSGNCKSNEFTHGPVII